MHQSWKTLVTHYDSIRNVHLRTLFKDDPKRGERFTLGTTDCSSTTPRTELPTKPLRSYANWRGVAVRSRIQAMFGGDKINVTEDRASCTSRCACPNPNPLVINSGC